MQDIHPLYIIQNENNNSVEKRSLRSMTGVAVGPRTWSARQLKSNTWNSFRKVCELNVDGFVTVAVRQDTSCELVTVKRFTNTEAARKVAMLQRIRHKNFLPMLRMPQLRKLS
jgi:hypothetical protein